MTSQLKQAVEKSLAEFRADLAAYPNPDMYRLKHRGNMAKNATMSQITSVLRELPSTVVPEPKESDGSKTGETKKKGRHSESAAEESDSSASPPGTVAGGGGGPIAPAAVAPPGMILEVDFHQQSIDYFQEVVHSLFDDVSIPVDIALGAAFDLEGRFRSRGPLFKHMVRHGVHLFEIVEYERKQARSRPGDFTGEDDQLGTTPGTGSVVSGSLPQEPQPQEPLSPTHSTSLSVGSKFGFSVNRKYSYADTQGGRYMKSGTSSGRVSRTPEGGRRHFYEGMDRDFLMAEKMKVANARTGSPQKAPTAGGASIISWNASVDSFVNWEEGDDLGEDEGDTEAEPSDRSSGSPHHTSGSELGDSASADLIRAQRRAKQEERMKARQLKRDQREATKSSPVPSSDQNFVKMNKKEQTFQVAQLLAKALDVAKGDEVKLEDLYNECTQCGIIRPVKNEFKNVQRIKFSRLVHSSASQLPGKKYQVAVGDYTLVDLNHLRLERAAHAPVVTKSSDNFDRGFQLTLHLMNKHFHLKMKGASVAEYPGHNICVVLFDPKGRIVGYDFNQCKFDKNLCSHAEKRMAEALTRILAQFTPDGKPPSLEGYSFMSSLEPCHMCANFISRMGVRDIGYLMKDPMQKEALDAAAKLLDLEVYRAGFNNNVWGTTLEKEFGASKVWPEDEITSWLGDTEFKTILETMTAQYPLTPGTEEASFFDLSSDYYPGCIALVDHPGASDTTAVVAGVAGASKPVPTDGGSSFGGTSMPRVQTTEDLLEDLDEYTGGAGGLTPSKSLGEDDDDEHDVV